MCKQPFMQTIPKLRYTTQKRESSRFSKASKVMHGGSRCSYSNFMQEHPEFHLSRQFKMLLWGRCSCRLSKLGYSGSLSSFIILKLLLKFSCLIVPPIKKSHEIQPGQAQVPAPGLVQIEVQTQAGQKKWIDE